MSGTNRIRLEDINWLEIAKRMKDDLKNPPNKVEGSFSSDNIQAVAKEIAKYYDYADWLNDMHFVETAEGEYLDKKAKEVGIERKGATYATGVATFYGKLGTVINYGTVITANGIDFKTTEMATITKDSVVIPVKSLNTGIGVNVGKTDNVDFKIDGVTRVVFGGASGGSDVEDDEHLRERTLLRMRYPGSSGNKYHYMHWAMEVEGVGRVKVFPLWKGNGTVKVSILDSNNDIATKELIDKVKEHIDGNANDTGEALAPIGAYLTVSTAKAKVINIKAKINLLKDYELSGIVEAFKANMKKYLSDIAYKDTKLTVARAIDILWNIEGVEEIVSLNINDTSDNIMVKDEEILKLGEVVIS